MRKGLILVGTLVVLLAAGLCFGEMPKLIHYQGYLTDDSGNPITDTLDITFSIYDDTTTGNLEWSEDHIGVEVLEGFFNVVLGQNSALDLPFNEYYWLEVEVISGVKEIMPRVRLTSVGYAYRALRADTAIYAQGAGQADTAQYASQAHTADSALWADTAGYAFVALTQRADSAFYADSALWADTSGYSLDGLQARRADSADYALWADTADYAFASPGGGGGDDDWKLRIEGTADTSLVTGGAWGISRLGTLLRGDVDSTHVNLGVEGKTGSTVGDRKYCTVGGGFKNVASGNNATVSGGWVNIAGGISATVVGGLSNRADGDYSFVGGGNLNKISEDMHYATVAGGYTDTANGYAATVGGGYHNVADSTGATVAGGWGNRADGYASTVAGGENNLAGGDYSTVLGGYANTIDDTTEYSYLFGIQSNLTQDSTFMVDMPYIRFGDEINGYQFPASDGGNAQVMMTDGNGQLTWTAIGWADDGGAVRLETATDSVGIGVTGPTEKLDVDGTARLRGIGTDPGGTVGVLVDDNGVLYKSSSSIRYKKNVKDLKIDLNDILGLQSVRFEWKNSGKEDIGLIAEDVDQVIPDLVSYNQQGKPNGVRYEKLSVYLLEALKELKAENEMLKQRIEALETR
jgi:hypothetical protein